VAIRARTKGWQVIVYAGRDPITGRQRQITRQVNGSRRQAEKVEARLRTHFMATQLGAVAEAGTVRERMGHGSLAVTSGYMHRVSEADRAAAEYMGALIDTETHQ
jgi:hypothetical protein